MQVLKSTEIADLLVRTRSGGRVSKGGLLVEAFLATGAPAATETFEDANARDALVISVNSYLRSTNNDGRVWVRKAGASDLLFIDLDQADETVRSLYNARPGRRRVVESNGTKAAAKAEAPAKKAPVVKKAAAKKAPPAKKAAPVKAEAKADASGLRRRRR